MNHLINLSDEYLIAGLPLSTKAEVQRRLKEAGNEMLDSIRGSLRGYPHCGGDIEVMAEVERIIREAVKERLEKCEAALKLYRISHDSNIVVDRPCRCIACDAARAAVEDRPCTCHPDDNPPRPCPKKYAYSECVDAARAALEGTK